MLFAGKNILFIIQQNKNLIKIYVELNLKTLYQESPYFHA